MLPDGSCSLQRLGYILKRSNIIIFSIFKMSSVDLKPVLSNIYKLINDNVMFIIGGVLILHAALVFFLYRIVSSPLFFSVKCFVTVKPLEKISVF